jgi:broad specificity phosphatase PhoE
LQTALNRQFVEWCSDQVERKVDRFLTLGVSDYLRHQGLIRMEYSDVVTADDASPSHGGPGAANGGRSYAPLISLMPLPHTKIIHFIRHGEGWHNVGLSNADAHLTPKGWEQSHALGHHMRTCSAATRDVQLVVISPLMRALETAAGVFGVQQDAGAALPQGCRPLMLAQSESPNERAAHAGVSARPGLQYLCNELCRERLGPSPCDQRRPRSQAAAAFPGVDFSAIEPNEDALWVAGKAEGEASVGQRGRQFLQFLMSRPETNIAVVTHSALLWFTLVGCGNECAKPVRESLQRWYENCEMRTVVMADGGGAGVADVTWFKGGHAFDEPQAALMEPGNGVRVAVRSAP